MIKLQQIEADVVGHCMNSCAGCNHFSPIRPKYVMDELTLLRDLAHICEFATFDKFALVGGEPLLHPDIDRIVEIVVATHFFKEVSIVTNGQLLHKMSEEFWRIVPQLEVDAYDGKLSDDMQEWIWAKICAAPQMVGMIVPKPLFAKALSGPTTPADAYKRQTACQARNRCFNVHEGYFYRCVECSLIPRMFCGRPEGTDGLALDGLTEAKLLAYINDTSPMVSCQRCASHSGEMPWHETSRDKWIEESTLA